MPIICDYYINYTRIIHKPCLLNSSELQLETCKLITVHSPSPGFLYTCTCMFNVDCMSKKDVKLSSESNSTSWHYKGLRRHFDSAKSEDELGSKRHLQIVVMFSGSCSTLWQAGWKEKKAYGKFLVHRPVKTRYIINK